MELERLLASFCHADASQTFAQPRYGGKDVEAASSELTAADLFGVDDFDLVPIA
jgi:hypothetical protein